MISEKTVELNLTTEFINWLSHLSNKAYFAIGPTQKQESKLGFDVAISGGSGALIQYKRAYVNGNIWRWKLNRTTTQDQHVKLQNLDSLGAPVFYALPLFHTIPEIQKHRRGLLLRTAWYRPSQINPKPNSIGHHDVIYDQLTSKWTVHSDEEVELLPPTDLRTVVNAIQNGMSPQHIAEIFNGLFGEPDGSLDQKVSAEESSTAINIVASSEA